MANRIGFSHHYSKIYGQTHGILAYASIYIIDRKWFPDETRRYDTDGVFPLDDGVYLQLVFIGYKQIPFTTYRKNTPENREKYCGHEREVFDFYFNGENSK